MVLLFLKTEEIFSVFYENNYISTRVKQNSNIWAASNSSHTPVYNCGWRWVANGQRCRGSFMTNRHICTCRWKQDYHFSFWLFTASQYSTWTQCTIRHWRTVFSKASIIFSSQTGELWKVQVCTYVATKSLHSHIKNSPLDSHQFSSLTV